MLELSIYGPKCKKHKKPWEDIGIEEAKKKLVEKQLTCIPKVYIFFSIFNNFQDPCLRSHCLSYVANSKPLEMYS